MKNTLITLSQRTKGQHDENLVLEEVVEILKKNQDAKMSIVKRKNLISASILLEGDIEIKKENHGVRVVITDIETAEHHEILKKYVFTD